MKDLPPYPDNTILIVEVGSTAHGTGLDGGEDHDETVIWIETSRLLAHSIIGMGDALVEAQSTAELGEQHWLEMRDAYMTCRSAFLVTAARAIGVE